MLNIDALSKSYTSEEPDAATHQVLTNLSLRLEKAQAAVISGPSGCGKSTLLNIIAGIIEADSGSVQILDQELTSLDEASRDEFRGQHIGYIFQNHNLLQGFTAAENLKVAAYFSGQTISDERIEQLLMKVDLLDYKDAAPSRLSLGQQQRIAIARALVHKPALVLADEPSSSLDKEQAQRCIALLLEMAAEESTAVLMVSHDERVFDQVGQVWAFEELQGVSA